MRIFTATLLKKKLEMYISVQAVRVQARSSAYIKKNIHSINKKINKEKTTRERF